MGMYLPPTSISCLSGNELYYNLGQRFYTERRNSFSSNVYLIHVVVVT